MRASENDSTFGIADLSHQRPFAPIQYNTRMMTSANRYVAINRPRDQAFALRRAKNPVTSAAMATAANRPPASLAGAAPGGPRSTNAATTTTTNAIPAHANA